LGCLLLLDSFAIYGANIWLLFKDVCGQNIVHMIAVLRAVQLGLVDERAVHEAIDGTSTLSIDEVLSAVREVLPDFAAEA
jgi:hypothetical protein